MASESIDELLVRYLGLLHEYTELRSQLANRQSAMYTNLARANFAAERGFRYGPDHFDGRMQALAKLSVVEDSSSSSDKEHALSYTVVRPKKEKEVKAEAAKEEEQEEDKQSKPEKQGAAKKTKGAAKSKAPRDPLQWFGVLAPMALRQAQTEAIEAIDNVIPRLASLSAEMAAVEIDVRRARKKRTRALEKQEKENKEATETTGRVEKSAPADAV
ncbi:hypothetical protein F503_04413 [Ophiostoma piceae UAMH 11346]|uniref:Vacuolar ATPase assembly protein VMA22 n=1 Tax=Ophiostoma piceae (strain UAMH 11346) TaxID=1262450 RepID=S3CA85_OPHP1|nr:hypothetical protein F503_04413 [Ophiostoma piceae UAMH 11346]